MAATTATGRFMLLWRALPIKGDASMMPFQMLTPRLLHQNWKLTFGTRKVTSI